MRGTPALIRVLPPRRTGAARDDSEALRPALCPRRTAAGILLSPPRERAHGVPELRDARVHRSGGLPLHAPVPVDRGRGGAHRRGLPGAPRDAPAARPLREGLRLPAQARPAEPRPLRAELESRSRARAARALGRVDPRVPLAALPRVPLPPLRRSGLYPALPLALHAAGLLGLAALRQPREAGLAHLLSQHRGGLGPELGRRDADPRRRRAHPPPLRARLLGLRQRVSRALARQPEPPLHQRAPRLAWRRAGALPRGPDAQGLHRRDQQGQPAHALPAPALPHRRGPPRPRLSAIAAREGEGAPRLAPVREIAPDHLPEAIDVRREGDAQHLPQLR